MPCAASLISIYLLNALLFPGKSVWLSNYQLDINSRRFTVCSLCFAAAATHAQLAVVAVVCRDADFWLRSPTQRNTNPSVICCAVTR